MSEIRNIDEKDLKILEMLASNARIPYTEMGKVLGISDVAVLKRVRKLEANTIKRYTIVINPRSIGYRAISITGIDVEPELLFKVIENLKNRDYVKELWLTSGDHTIMAVIWARDEDEMAKIHSEISRIAGVKRVCPAIVLRSVKNEGPWFYVE